MRSRPNAIRPLIGADVALQAMDTQNNGDGDPLYRNYKFNTTNYGETDGRSISITTLASVEDKGEVCVLNISAQGVEPAAIIAALRFVKDNESVVVSQKESRRFSKDATL